MRTSDSAQYAVSLCVAIAVLAGCNGAADITPTQNGSLSNTINSYVPGPGNSPVRAGVSLPVGGGSFKASYSGSFTSKKFYCGRYCIGHTYEWSGTGSGNFIRRSKESGGTSFEWMEPVGPCLGGRGLATLTSASHPQNSVVMAITVGKMAHTCADWHWTVQSGTGKFRTATGSGGLGFRPNGQAYTDRWKGALSF